MPASAPLRRFLDQTSRKAITILILANDTAWTPDGYRTTRARTLKKAKTTGPTFHDLRGTAVTRLAVAGASEAQIATVTGHSLKDAGAILDAHYLNGDARLAETAIQMREAHEAGTDFPN